MPRRSRTGRGFALYEWVDSYGEKCSIQKSSIATADMLWLGVDSPSVQLVGRVGPPRPFELPPDAMVSSRMHITRAQARKPAKLLAHFAETGEL